MNKQVLDLKEKYKTAWRDKPECYWFSRLVAEVGELGSSLADDHEHSPDLELAQIASICLNWLEIRDNQNRTNNQNHLSFDDVCCYSMVEEIINNFQKIRLFTSMKNNEAKQILANLTETASKRVASLPDLPIEELPRYIREDIILHKTITNRPKNAQAITHLRNVYSSAIALRSMR